MILEHFNEFRTTAVITRLSNTKVNGVITPSSSSVGSFSVLFWEGSAANAFVDERFKDRTAAAIALPPSSGVQKGDKVVVGGNTYKALDPDNVGYAGEYTLVGLEVYG